MSRETPHGENNRRQGFLLAGENGAGAVARRHVRHGVVEIAGRVGTRLSQ